MGSAAAAAPWVTAVGGQVLLQARLVPEEEGSAAEAQGAAAEAAADPGAEGSEVELKE